MRAREPRQVREEAAVSGFSHVPQGFLTGAGYAGTAWGGRSEISARPIFVYFHIHRLHSDFRNVLLSAGSSISEE